jgi:3-dehydroquinate dehydratase-2
MCVTVTTFASNFEGAILEFIHESAKSSDTYVINPAGRTEGGVATKHALRETGKPYVEVHCQHSGSAHCSTRPANRAVAFNILSLAMALDDQNFLGAELTESA